MDTYDGSMDAPAGRRPTRGAPAQGDEYDFAIDFEPRREYREGDKEEPGTNNFGREWGNLMKAKKGAERMLKPGRGPGETELIAALTQ